MALITKFVVILLDDNNPQICNVQQCMYDNYIQAAEAYHEYKKYHPGSIYRIGTIQWNESPAICLAPGEH